MHGCLGASLEPKGKTYRSLGFQLSSQHLEVAQADVCRLVNQSRLSCPDGVGDHREQMVNLAAFYVLHQHLSVYLLTPSLLL